MTPLEENHEFTNTSGSITFTTGEETKPIVLEAISDKIPEFNEFFVLRLVNISGEFKIKVTYLSDFTIFFENPSTPVHDFFKVVTQGRVDDWQRLL